MKWRSWRAISVRSESRQGVIETQAEDAAIEGVEWRALWSHLGHQNGFVDLDDRTLPWAQKYKVAARRGYIRGRRFFVEDQRAQQRLKALMAEEQR